MNYFLDFYLYIVIYDIGMQMNDLIVQTSLKRHSGL